MAATTTTKSRMAMRTPQPRANLFMTIMDNWERLLFQDRSDLGSNYLPLTALLHKCIGPDKFAAEKILLCLPRFDHAFADDDRSVAIKTNLQILNLEFGELDVGHAFQI